jgi:hypothetical protein
LVVAQSSSEIPEGLMNNPVYIYIYIHAYIHACIHAYIHTYIHTYILCVTMKTSTLLSTNLHHSTMSLLKTFAISPPVNT